MEDSHLAGILDHQLLDLMESIPIGVWSWEETTILYSNTQDGVNIVNVLVADLRHFPDLSSLTCLLHLHLEQCRSTGAGP